MDIEVGEYVRVENITGNVIARIIEDIGTDDDKQMYLIDRIVQHDWDCIRTDEIYESDIVKHSKDIIDVLEVGDIVAIKINDDWNKIVEIRDTENLSNELLIDRIVSVLTREQYESNAYRLEE